MKTKLFALTLIFLATSCASSPKDATATQNSSQATPAPVQGGQPSASTIDTSQPLKQSICRKGHEVRSVSIEAVAPNGCEVWYSKYGDRSRVAWSKQAIRHCDSVQTQIVDNLTKSNYKCRTTRDVVSGVKK